MKLNNKDFFFVVLLLPVIKLNAQQGLFIDKQEYSCATSFNIAARTKNITNAVALQGTVLWDTAVIKYNGISYGSSSIQLNSSNVNISAAANGYLSFLWFDNNLQGHSLADSTSLFTINFVANGTGKGKGFINFSNTPTSLEIDTLNGAGEPVNNLSAAFTNGYIVTPAVYNFTGTGNWTIAANWKNNLIPPALLPACSEIIVEPSGSGECILNVQQTAAPGAKFTIAAGKKFSVAGSLKVY